MTMHPGTGAILDVIRGLPAVTQRTRLRSPRDTSEREYRGPLLFDYVKAVGLLGAGASGVGQSDHYLLVTASDGMRATVALAEVAPRFSSKSCILAYEQDGEPMQVGVRLIVPGDDLGGRSLLGVASIEMRSVASSRSGQRAASAAIEVGGLLEKPFTLDEALFDSLPQVDVVTLPTPQHGGVTRPARSYRGVRVYDLLDHAGIVLDEAVHEDFLNKIIMARSVDGYAAVLAGGELEPRFMNGDAVIVRHSENGEPSFRLVVPFDQAIGRAVKNVVSLELQAATQ